MWVLTQRFWEMTKLFVKCLEVRHKYVANGLNILNKASMCGKRLKYLRNGITMLEMTEDFDKRLIYLRNDAYMQEMA